MWFTIITFITWRQNIVVFRIDFIIISWITAHIDEIKSPIIRNFLKFMTDLPYNYQSWNYYQFFFFSKLKLSTFLYAGVSENSVPKQFLSTVAWFVIVICFRVGRLYLITMQPLFATSAGKFQMFLWQVTVKKSHIWHFY